MSKEKPPALLTHAFITLIERARELNEDKMISGYLYFHPAESANQIIVKTTDLNQLNPLREVNSKAPARQAWEERWIEAYLLNKAKENGWELKLAKKTYRFLASQFTFRESPSHAKGRRKHTHIDLLLYDEVRRCLVVLELKKQAVVSSLVAQEALAVYVEKMKRLISEENSSFNKAFDLNVTKDTDVIGYVVCPKSDRRIKPEALGHFNLIQYDRPWKDFTEVEASGKKLNIDFEEPENPE